MNDCCFCSLTIAYCGDSSIIDQRSLSSLELNMLGTCSAGDLDFDLEERGALPPMWLAPGATFGGSSIDDGAKRDIPRMAR